MEYREYCQKLYQLLALEYNCAPEAFSAKENILTVPVLLEGRRMYSSCLPFFSMVTTGCNTVITADPCMHPFLGEYIKGKQGHWLFEQPNLLKIEKELEKHGYSLLSSFHMFLPKVSVEPRGAFDVRWYDEKALASFYGDGRFSNALCENALRPDRLGVAAFSGDQLMGLAGCSEDAPGWMQIGIDVLPEFRSRGVGTYLVTLLKNKIQELGAVPFYGTSLSNYHSWNIALNAGFRPAWVEIVAKDMRKYRKIEDAEDESVLSMGSPQGGNWDGF